MNKDIEIICVNYNTPDLLERMIKSVIKHEGEYPIRVIDGSDRREFVLQTFDLEKKYHNVSFLRQGWNIHHGRGMDLGVSTSNRKYTLIIDSDNYLMQPVIDIMYSAMKGKKIVGWYCFCNEKGVGKGREYTPESPIKYWHPSVMLLDTDYYRELKKNGITFIHHGAPCIKIMKFLHDQKLSDVVGLDILDQMGVPFTDIGQWFNLDNSKHQSTRGTVNRFGRNY